MGDVKISNTPYDDVFRTLLNDCSSLIIPVINEIFGEDYSGNEKIIFSLIIDMSNKVLEHIAKKYDSVRKGVKSVMGGRVLEYEAKTIRNEGIKEGMEKGIEKGIEKGMDKGIRGTVSILKKLEVPAQTILVKIQEQYNLSPEDSKKYL